MPYEYAWEKLYNAVQSLAGNGALRDRVYDAILSFHTLQFNKPELPAQVQTGLAKLWAVLDKTDPVGNEGRWRASINAMTESELDEHAHEIVDLYDTICRYQEPSD